MPVRLAIIVSHPIQYFAPWHRELARLPDVELKVFFCCDWGVKKYVDPGFKVEMAWDIPLLEGYPHEFLPFARPIQRLGFRELDNPGVGAALDRFQPDVVKIFGYAHRTNWRAARWARRNQRPVLLYSDSNGQVVPRWWKRPIKDFIIGKFYETYVDGAFFIGENNRRYHARYGLPPERLFRGSLPIDIRRLLATVSDRDLVRRELRSKLGMPSDCFAVMFCGKYQPHKRPLDLLMAASSLVEKGLPVWCVLVGDGPERENMAAFCNRQKLHNVSLTGFINQSQIASYYVASDVLAMSSSLDAYGLSVSEAAAFGLPIVISDRVGCIGPNDSAQPGRNALVYRCGDVQALANAIERLWRDRDLYRHMASKSSEIALSQDVTAAAQELSAAVRQLHQLGRRSHPKNRFQPAPEVAAS